MSSAAARTYLHVERAGAAAAEELGDHLAAYEDREAIARSLTYQAARAQELLDRIADVSDVAELPAAADATMAEILERLDAREAMLSDLEPVVAELSLVRGELAGQGEPAAQARALHLALAPVEQAARRALDFHAQLLEKMQAMRDEMVWELDRLDRLDTVAQGYLHAAPPPDGQLDVRR